MIWRATNSLDHGAGSTAPSRLSRNLAENVAAGCETERPGKGECGCNRRRTNMMLADARQSRWAASGRRYWAMEIGGNSCVVLAVLVLLSLELQTVTMVLSVGDFCPWKQRAVMVMSAIGAHKHVASGRPCRGEQIGTNCSSA